MAGRVASHRSEGVAGGGAGQGESGKREQSAGQARGGEVDDIVETGGGPAKCLMARRAVADHAVGGVDRFVGGDTGQSQQRKPERGRDNAIGGVLGEAFDGGAANGGFVEAGGVAADDAGDASAAFRQPAIAQRGGDGGGMIVKAAAGKQRTGGKRDEDETVGQPHQRRLQSVGERGGNGDDDDEGGDAKHTAGSGSEGFAVQGGIEGGNQRTNPGDRVANGSIEGLGIAKDRLDAEREQETGEESCERHDEP